MSLQALREQRAAKAKALNDLLTANPEKWTPENQAEYDTGLAELDHFDARIKNITDLNERVAADAMNENLIEAGERRGKDKGDVVSAMFAKWLRVGDEGMSAEDRAIIVNTMSTTTGSEGGFTVQKEVAAVIVEALKAYGGMRQSGATVLVTDTGSDLDYPNSDGTSEEGEIVAQNASVTAADPGFGVTTIPVFKFSSKSVAVPIELLQDSAVDIEAFVRNRLVTRIGRITNKKFTIGTGTGEPRGVVTAAGAGKVGTTGQTLTVTYDDLVDLQHSVDPAYRANGGKFMMNDQSVKVIRKVKDTSGRPIFVPGYEMATSLGVPDMLLGSAIQVNQDCPVMAANAKSILFGDFSPYVIRDVMALNMFRFTDSAFATKGQVGFLMLSRHGGNFTDVGGAVKYYQNSAT